jgi:hypothetical protein
VPTLGEQYAKSVKQEADRYGTFPPDITVVVGDVFEMKKGRLIRIASGSELPGWPTGLQVKSDEKKGKQTYYSGSSRTRGGEASAGVTTAAVGAQATIELEFSKTGGFVLDYVEQAHYYYGDVQPVMRWALAAAKNGNWEKSWVVITESIKASSATIVVGAKRGHKVQLSATAALPTDVFGVNLADPKLGLTVSSWDNKGFVSLAKAATPMYRCLRIRSNLLTGTHAELLAANEEDVAKAFTEDPFTDDV